MDKNAFQGGKSTGHRAEGRPSVRHALCSVPFALSVFLATTSCGDVARSSKSPVYLVLNSLTGASGGGHAVGVFAGTLLSDVIVVITTGGACTVQTPCPTIFNDTGQAVISLAMKDIGTPTNAAVPTTNNQVTINQIHVEYTRADGHNTPGVDVPYAFDGAATATIPINGSVTIGFELVRHTAKEEPPLIQLRNSGQIITTIANVTFFGHDLVGNAVSVTGSIQIDFGNFGDT